MGRKTVFLLMSLLCLRMATVLVQIEPGPKVSDINFISSTLLKYVVDLTLNTIPASKCLPCHLLLRPMPDLLK